MKFRGFMFSTAKDWIFIIPTVVIQLNDPCYIEKSLLIAFHFLIWHFRWYWRERVRYDKRRYKA